MICGCQKRPSAATWLTRILSLVSVPDPSPTADSVTRRCGLLPSHGAQKNVLWDVRHDASQLLRPNTAPGAGLVERTVPRSARHRGSSDPMPPVSRGEARATGVPG